mgnify:FL=1
MHISFTITLLMSALILGSLAVVHTGEKYRDKIFGAPAIKIGEKLFDTHLLDKTRQINMANTNGVDVRIAQTGHFWSTTEPWNDRADPMYVKAIFQFTSSLVVKDVIDRDNVELDDFTLEEGSIRITMSDSDGSKLCDYKIGRTTAWKIPSDDGKRMQQTIFIRLADKEKKNKIYICTSNATAAIHSLFSSNFERFRDHHPLHFSPKFLDKISIQNEESEIVISRPNLNAGWMITKPDELQIDIKATKQLFIDLAQLNALKVEDRSSVTLPTAAADASHAQEISIHFADQAEDITMRIYPPANEDSKIALVTVSDRPDTVFHLPLTKSAAIPGTPSLALLQSGVNDLRSKNMVSMDGKQLKTIIIRPGGLQDILLQRETQSAWKVRHLDGWRPANTDTLIRLITAFTQDKIVNFITDAATDLSPYGLDQPLLLLGFKSFNGDTIQIAIGRGAQNPEDQNRKLYARILDRPNIWEISNETLGKIALHPWQWRTSHAWHIPDVDIKKIIIHRKKEPVVELTYNSFSDAWTSKTEGKESSTRLNTDRAKLFLKQLTSLKASRWIGPMHPGAMKAIASPDTVIKVHVQEFNDDGTAHATVVKTLKIAHTSGRLINFAKIDSLPVGRDRDHEASYFFLSPEVITKLHVNLFE